MIHKYSSFISEHTAEYFLVPTLTNILKESFQNVIPIFPWLNREGGKTSIKLHKDFIIKVLALYPRRPKVSITSEKLQIKISGELFQNSTFLLENNIPTIAGCPLINNLWQNFNLDTFFWVKINPNTKEFYSVDNNKNEMGNFNIIPKDEILTTPNSILEYVNSKSGSMDILELFEIIREGRYHVTPRFMFGGYKPIYFLLNNNC